MLGSVLQCNCQLVLALIKDFGIDDVVKKIIDGSLTVLNVACHSQGTIHKPCGPSLDYFEPPSSLCNFLL